MVLNYNVFMFVNVYYRQIKGITMGTSCAIIIANIYVAYQERTIIIAKYRLNYVTYLRYIDDIFTIWIDGLNGLTTEDLKRDLHQCELTWTVTKPDTQLVFLDVTVHIYPNTGDLHTTS